MLKLKMGSVQMNLHSGVTRTFDNVRYVSDARVNLISLGKLTSHGCRYIDIGKWCKVFRWASLVVQGKQVENNMCYVEGRCIPKCKTVKKKVRFSDVIEVFGDLGRGRKLLGISPNNKY